MLRKEEKSEPQKTIHQLLEKEVTHLSVYPESRDVAIYFQTEELADQVREVLKIEGRWSWIILNRQQQQALWGKQGESILHEAENLLVKDKKVKLTKLLVSTSISNPSLYQLLVRQCNVEQNSYVFHHALSCLQNQPVEVCIQLIDAMSDKTLNQVMRLWDSYNKTSALLFTFHGQSPEVCIRLIDRMTDANLAFALMFKNKKNEFAFNAALARQSPEVCLWLFDRLENKALFKLCFQKNKEAESLEKATIMLRSALLCQPPKVCIRLIELFGRAKNGMLRSVATDNLLKIARYQSEDVFAAIVNKLSPKALSKAVNGCSGCLESRDGCVMGIAAQYQTAASFQLFLRKLAHRQVKEMVNEILNIFSYIYVCFKKIALYQTLENVEIFLSILDEKNREKLLEVCKEKLNSSETRFALRALQFKLEKRESVKKADIVDSPSLVGMLESKPVEPPVSPDPMLAKLLDLLHQHAEQKSADEKKPATLSETEEKAIKQFSAGVFVKIIRDDKIGTHANFVKHLFNPVNRDIIRDQDGYAKQGFKLLLNPPSTKEKNEAKKEKAAVVVYACPEGYPKVIKARTEKEREQHKVQKPKSTSTTKHPVTYISTHLNTALFGFHASREMVGYAFVPNEQNIKLLSTQDCGTYNRWWYNKERNPMIGMAEYAKKIICKSFAEFVKRIDAQPYVVNEALVKLTPLDLFAIVIGKDTKEARSIAIARRLEMIRLNKVDLPILIYDPEKRKVSAYTAIDQHHEHPQIFLTEFKTVIEQAFLAEKRARRFFSKPSASTIIKIHIDAGIFTISQATAQNIISIINSLTEKSHQAFTDIMAILEHQKEHALRQLGI